ncbi:hypothetical protein PF003_g18853 [Phytophthora fragariae]|nr:hypothetical protein PF003_g18853 [Phytophthora fragariae]
MREPLLDRLISKREPLLDRLISKREPLLDRFLHRREPLLDRPFFIRGSHGCSTARLSPARPRAGSSSSSPVSSTAHVVQRGPSLALRTTCAVDAPSTTVTWGQSLGVTKRCVKTSVTSKS